jgi:hypothetical protein
LVKPRIKGSQSPITFSQRNFVSATVGRPIAQSRNIFQLCAKSSLSRSGGEIEPSGSLGALDFNNPKIRVKFNFSREPFVGLVGANPTLPMGAGKGSVARWLEFDQDRLRRGTIHGRPSVQMVDFDENRPCLRSAAAPQDRVHPLNSASAQKGGDPDVRTETHST